ncbi:MAG: hypothetical protein WC933_02195 [Candidatus Paceibacterota bacterium]|jgi:hypothetical protein
MKNILIVVVGILMMVVAGCTPPNVVDPGCVLCAQQTQTALANATATPTNVIEVGTATFTPTMTATEIVVNTATATMTSTEVMIATATATATRNTNIRDYYVEIKSNSNQAGYFEAWVGKRPKGDVSPVTRGAYYMDQVYNYVWTSTVVQLDSITEGFHLEGICTDQIVNIKVYRKMDALNPSSVYVKICDYDAAPNLVFSTNN